MGAIVVDHILDQCLQLLHGGVLAVAAAGAAVMVMVMIVVMVAVLMIMVVMMLVVMVVVMMMTAADVVGIVMHSGFLLVRFSIIIVLPSVLVKTFIFPDYPPIPVARTAKK
jgi:hypothetical protein